MQTEVIKVAATKGTVAASGPSAWSLQIKRAARALAQGGIVGFPTETVYGLAANADSEAAMKRLRQLKEREADKPFSFLAAEAMDVHRLVPDPLDSGLKLARKFWPGPLTIIFPSGREGIGIRVPAHDVARELVRLSGVRVVAPSANPSGMKPAGNADEVLRYYDGEIDAVIDSGPSALKEASTVVRLINEFRWEILREGLISREMIAKTILKTVLFVCTGNSCRSPIAAAVFRREIAAKLKAPENELESYGVRVISAGTAATHGSPVSYEAFEAMERLGYDISRHTAQDVTPAMADSADKIYVMTRRHYDSIVNLMPNVEPRVRLLDPSGHDIEDPMGGSRYNYRECVETIQKLVKELVRAEF